MKYNVARFSFGLIMLIAVVMVLTMGFLTKPAKQIPAKVGKGFAVVELFTSEGCSSCPSADVAVEKISLSHPENLFALGFHVDYWNRLGWKDEFSDAAYSQRQRGYADHFKLNSIYTPQVVVNGKEELVGSDATRLKRSVDTEIKNTANLPIELSAIGSSGKTVQVTYKMDAPANTVVNIALVQIATQTQVKRGENEGRTLHHINIVRDFKTVALPGNTGPISLTLPNGTATKEYKVIVYTQHRQTRAVTGAAAAFIK